MPKFSILALICAASTIGASLFIGYTSTLWLDVYSLTHNSSITVLDLETKPQDNGTLVETELLVQNPSRLYLKIEVINLRIYGDSSYTDLLGEGFLRWQNSSYVVNLSPLSNGTAKVQAFLSSTSPSDLDYPLHLRVLVYVREIPLLENSQILKYLEASGETS